jgi:nucleotide-binding universal stress UspA family protein
MLSSIVVGTDGSDTAQIAVDHAAELARALGAKLHIVSAYTPVAVRVNTSGAPEGEEWSVGPDLLGEEVLARARATVSEVEVETHACRGDAAEALIETAQDVNADMIVVGNRGMTGTRRFLLGSVPNQISHHAPCSVLIVRTT